MSPKLSIIALSIVPPVAILSRIYGRYVQNITKQVQDSLADATQVSLLASFSVAVMPVLSMIFDVTLHIDFNKLYLIL
jgi:ABC-type multidrug transport system fused ATPase/permease subunit